MAIAHVCIQCGWDLARVRPQRDPHYQLPLVVCPRCRHACVRRMHPVWKQWRKFLRVDRSLRVLSGQLAIVVLLSALTSMLTLATLHQLVQIGRPPIPPAHSTGDLWPWLLIWYFAGLALITGSWLTAAFNHRRRLRVWLAWMTFMQLPLAMVSVAMSTGSTNYYGRFEPFSVDPNGRDFLVNFAVFHALGTIFFSLVMLTATVGIPVGWMLLRLSTAVKRSRWRWMRKRRGQWRNA